MAYQRKTIDIFELQANYGGGFECVTTELTRKEIRQRLKEYRANGDHAPMKIVKKRERIEGAIA